MRAVNPMPPASAPLPVTHYENFPVASLLCPPALRAPIAAIYAFARTADDIADEGDASTAQRAITEVYSGILAVPARLLAPWLARLTNHNAHGEY